MKVSFILTLVLASCMAQAQTNKAKDSKVTPLWIVDGEKMPAQKDGTRNNSFLDIKPEEIKSISVFKGDSALLLYGEAGRNGVIVITTKNSRTRKSETHP